MNLTTFIKKSFAAVKALLMAVLFLAFIGGAAMAFQPGVSDTAKAIGLTVWISTFLITAGWIASALTSKFVGEYAKFREGDNGFLTRFVVLIVLFIIVLVLMSTALAIH